MKTTVALVVAVVALLLVVSTNAQSPDGVPGPQLVYVNKYRTWTGSSERLFRPDNKSAVQLNRFKNPIDPPHLSKFAMGFDHASGDMLVFGGEQQNENIPGRNIAAAKGELYSYDFDLNEWYNQTTFTDAKPAARLDHAGWSWPGVGFFIHGGENDTVNGDVWGYHNRTWREYEWNMPKRKGHSGDVLDPAGPAYLFGGLDETGLYKNELWTLTTNGTKVLQVNTLGTPPTPRAYHASAKMYSEEFGWLLFIHGGTDGVKEYNDLYVYYAKTRTWRLINEGFTPQVYAFDRTILPKVNIPTVSRHACAASYPTMMCVGGKTVSTQIVMEYDFATERWVRVLFTNPTRLPPTNSHKLVAHKRLGTTELMVVGGVTGAPTRFTNPDVLHKTSFFMQPCPQGYINPDGDGKCFKCASGYGVDPLVHPRECRMCLKGTFSNRDGYCEKCPIGTFLPYNMSTNASACIRCPAGYFTVEEGSFASTQCKTCDPGFYSKDLVCTKCPPGTKGAALGQLYVDLGCEPCPYGEWSDEGASTCTPCAPGTTGGPFVQRQYPYRVMLRNFRQRTNLAYTGGCVSDNNPPATVQTTSWYQVTVNLQDYGWNDDGNAGTTVERIRVDQWNDQGSILQLTASFENNEGVMYHDCVNLDPVPSCSSVGMNETTPAINRGDYAQSCDGNREFTFRLRFSKPNQVGEQTRLRIFGESMKPLVMDFTVINPSFTVEFTSGSPLSYAAGITPQQGVSIRALDGGGDFDPTINGAVTVRTRCGTGTANPQMSVDQGASYGTSRSVTLVAGEATFYPSFREGVNSKDCSFEAGSPVTVSPFDQFQIQTTTAMIVQLRTANTSSHGVMRADVYLVNASGDTVVGDNTSMISIGLAPDPRMRDLVWIKDVEKRRQVTMGHTVFDMTVFTFNRTLVWGRFLLKQIQGQPTFVNDVISDRFYITPANGTLIRLVEDGRHRFPSEVKANTTFTIEFEVVDKFGQHDASRSPDVLLTLTDCPGATLLFANTTLRTGGPVVTQLPMKMGFGRGIATVYIRGTADADSCRFGVHETSTPDRTTGFWSPPFKIRTPKRIVHDWCAYPTGCGSCPQVELGAVMTFNISLESLQGHAVTNEEELVVRMDVLGNATAAYEYDAEPERRVSRGKTTFRVFMGETTDPYHLVFSAGYWATEVPENITYATVPSFTAIFGTLAPRRVFRKIAYISAARTCEINPAALAKRIVLSPTKRVPTWVSNGAPISFDFEAVNEFGQLDPTFNGQYRMEIENCNHGVRGDYSWRYDDPQTTTNTAYNAAPGANGISPATFLFATGRGSMTVYGTYGTESTLNGGLEGCSIKIKATGLQDLVVEGFSIRRLSPSCALCPPGTFSPGGTGQNLATYPFHPGGCIPCMIGTFSADSGASSEAVCQVCPANYGYFSWQDNRAREGVTGCTTFCSGGSQGQSGGGPCPAGSIYARTAGQDLSDRRYGTIGRRCNLAICQTADQCGPGQWKLHCTNDASHTTPAACEDAVNKGNCYWNYTSAQCEGTLDICVDCPAGRLKTWWSATLGVGLCASCNRGGWSSNEGQSAEARSNALTFSEYRCASSVGYNDICTGTGTGYCWNGTYSQSWAATSNATCLPCPKGFICYVRKMYRWNDPVGGGGYYANSNCGGRPINPCQWHGLTSDYNCPLTDHNFEWGTIDPIPCPEGTYNELEGQSDLSACIVCPAGTYCPAGTVTPTKSDPSETQFDLSGTARPDGVSFYGGTDRLQCTDPATDDAAGYIRDGHFTWLRSAYVTGRENSVPSYWNNIDDRFDLHQGRLTINQNSLPTGSNPAPSSATDHTGETNSGGVFMNATQNPKVWQKVELNHVTVVEMTARLWIYNRLVYRNISKIMNHDIATHRPFAGFELTVYRTENITGTPGDEQYYAKSISTTAPQSGSWMLLEITFTPPWPVMWANFNITTRGWYQGFAVFDDASLRPSHRRICNCSTGFYFNDTEPSRKCRRCPPGFACSGGTMIRCVNSWSTSGFAGCLACRDGWLCDSDGRGRHIPCEPMTKKSNNTETCSPCPVGYACRDGVQSMCNDGRYGDGGTDCIVCFPGYYSPASGKPEIECKRCAPGLFSVAGRASCSKCPANHYSPNGTACYECPAKHFAPQVQATACRSCLGQFLDTYNFTFYRNGPARALRIVPPVCIEDFDFKVERIQHMEGESLGTVDMSESTPSVLYRAGPVIGLHRFRVFVTSDYKTTDQWADVEVRIENQAPVAQDDLIIIPHPTAPLTYALSAALFNDFDEDTDDVYFATAALGSTPYGATNLQISANRKELTVDLPFPFTGPATFVYSIMDKPAVDASSCVAPTCRISASTATITLIARTAAPVASNDSFIVQNGQVTSLDVLLNDTDPNGDEIVIMDVTAATFGTTPTIRQTCTACSGACNGIASCTCAFDAQRNKCYPSNGRQWFLDYTSLTTRCGTDRFSYRIGTNDGASTGYVDVTSIGCFCSSHTTGVDVVFVLDGTASESDYAFQLNFMSAVQQRSTPGVLFWGAVQAGVNADVKNVDNTFLDPTAYTRDPQGNIYPYDLNAAMELARLQKVNNGLGSRYTVVVMLSGSESTTPVGGSVTTLGQIPGVNFVTISINPVNLPYDHSALIPNRYAATVLTFADLVGSNGKYVKDVMDAICSLGT